MSVAISKTTMIKRTAAKGLKYGSMALTPLIASSTVYAHCPLCTAGAAAAAGGAAWLGVSHSVIGVFIGAFAISTGWWVSRMIKKQIVPFQHWILLLVSFAMTIIPIQALFADSPYPILISWWGDYGTLFNRTYLLNLFLIGSLVGGFIVVIAPWLSEQMTALRNGKTFPYQGLTITFALLFLISVVLQVAI